MAQWVNSSVVQKTAATASGDLRHPGFRGLDQPAEDFSTAEYRTLLLGIGSALLNVTQTHLDNVDSLALVNAIGTSAGNINIDCALGVVHTVTLGGNHQFQIPTNVYLPSMLLIVTPAGFTPTFATGFAEPLNAPAKPTTGRYALQLVYLSGSDVLVSDPYPYS